MLPILAKEPPVSWLIFNGISYSAVSETNLSKAGIKHRTLQRWKAQLGLSCVSVVFLLLFYTSEITLKDQGRLFFPPNFSSDPNQTPGREMVGEFIVFPLSALLSLPQRE